jgi:hypothetical protein
VRGYTTTSIYTCILAVYGTEVKKAIGSRGEGNDQTKLQAYPYLLCLSLFPSALRTRIEGFTLSRWVTPLLLQPLTRLCSQVIQQLACSSIESKFASFVGQEPVPRITFFTGLECTVVVNINVGAVLV